MDELAVALRTIPTLAGKRTYAYPSDDVNPPAGIVGYPEASPDQTYQRGCDRWNVPVWVAVARADDLAARNMIGPYTSGSGVSSVKAAIDGHVYTSCDYAVAGDWAIEVVQIGGIDYLAARFAVDVAGSGE